MSKPKSLRTPKSNAGAPETISQEKIDKLVKALRKGSYIETAAAFAGISKDTLYAWLKKGARKEGAIYEQLSDAVEAALAFAEQRNVNLINKAGRTDWKAAAWMLERKHATRWGRKEIVKNIEGDAEDDKDAFGEQSMHHVLVDILEKKKGTK